jgi:WD40 repeat protein
VSIGPSQVEHNEEIPVYSPATTETLNVLISRGTLLIDIDTKTVRTVLNAHSDVVHCICPLPDGSILTAGGKMCAKVLLWDNNDISNAVQSEETVVLAGAKRMKEPGYVFDLQVLRDSDAVSTVYAIVGARYNVIKVVV